MILEQEKKNICFIEKKLDDFGNKIETQEDQEKIQRSQKDKESFMEIKSQVRSLENKFEGYSEELNQNSGRQRKKGGISRIAFVPIKRNCPRPDSN